MRGYRGPDASLSAAKGQTDREACGGLPRRGSTRANEASTTAQRLHVRPPIFYSVRAVSELLAVSDDSIRRAISRGSLPVHRFGRAVRISADDLETYLRSRRCLPPAAPVRFRRVETRDYARLLMRRVRREVSR